ncbi:MAG: DUF2730 domain-containing protein [Acetobacteraceae bacterium]|nr:DUF2730 domain-containing protein [Acetobacteraceae bacterium]
MDWLERHLALITAGLAVLMPIGGIIFRAQVHGMIKDRASAADVHAIEARLDTQETRLRAIEASIDHLPTKDQVHNLHLLLTGIGGDVKVTATRIQDLDTTIGGLTRRVELIDEHLKRASV